MRKKIDLTGERFGRLLVIREAGRDKRGKILWLCRCLGKNGDDCGNEVVVRGDHLRSESIKSCGCLRRKRITTHDCTQKPWYLTYQNMMKRCGHWKGASEHNLRDYRDRGITVCELWQKSPQDFGDWLLSHGWCNGLQIDRIDNNLGYCPENCRVVSQRENLNNRQNTVRLGDGTPLALFCYELGIITCGEGRKPTPQYMRIRRAWVAKHEPHPELMQALKENTDRQSRLLEITKLKCRRAELMIAYYKELLASKQTA